MTAGTRLLDLNADLGEGTGNDAALMPVITSASIACGGHAGDRASMSAACAMARDHRVQIGAHPSYPDREGFGRTPMPMTAADLQCSLGEQVHTLIDQAADENAIVSYIKPHGALYHAVRDDREHAHALATVAAQTGLPLLLAPVDRQAAIAVAAHSLRVRLLAEGFADRAYRGDGTLLPRGRSGAVLDDPDQISGRILHWLRTGEMPTSDGGDLPMELASICVHSDTPSAVTIAHRVAAAVAQAGVELAPFPGADRADGIDRFDGME